MAGEMLPFEPNTTSLIHCTVTPKIILDLKKECKQEF